MCVWGGASNSLSFMDSMGANMAVLIYKSLQHILRKKKITQFLITSYKNDENKPVQL